MREEGVIDRRERLEKGPTKATALEGGREEGDNQRDIIIIIIIIIGNKGRAQTVPSQEVRDERWIVHL